MQTDTELVLAALDGQSTAYATLVHRWGCRVVAICHARVGNADAADDLAQEVLLRGWNNLKSIECPDRFGFWLKGIAEHVCLDWIRRTGSRRKAHQKLADFMETPDVGGRAPRAPRLDDQERVLTEVNQLPEPLRDVVYLHYYDEISYDQIARTLGIARATVNARLAKARCLLARRLANIVEVKQGRAR